MSEVTSGTRADVTAAASERFIARAAAVTAALTAAGALFGLLRDQTLAHLFGAGGETDAFLVSWTLPEVAATLLIEEGMALVLIPAFSLALARRAAAGCPDPDDPVRALLRATLPRLALALAVLAAVLAVSAPVLVKVLAPGLTEPRLAIDCMRLTAVTVLTFGLAGYFSAALRAHRSFIPPAAIYLVYNLGIIATSLTLHTVWGVRAAAVGVAVGSVLMLLVQLPFFLRRLRLRLRLRGRSPWRSGLRRVGRATPVSGLVGFGVVAPVALFALSRQSQVLVERFFASSLPAGAISHLNYAQKVAQVPMVLSLMICTVTFPLVARAMADGQVDRARRRVERDLVLAGVVVLLGAAYVVAYAPQIIELLFQRGAFDEQATAATASVMRVYALGLLGHSLVGALVRPFFSGARPMWYPLAAMAVGLLITVGATAAAVPLWGVHGIAAANAVGISVTALLLLRGLGTRMIPLDVRRVLTGLGRLVVAAVAALAAGWAMALLLDPPLLTAALGALLVPAVFLLAARAVRVPEAALLLSTLRGKFCHVR
ncbi:lipid II flippase MurJ [Streptomyces sp. ACA25]|uniref:lipid II flippase MurJ n=1 Tax=Streptomyces sp. ACA25 TaxID=3022596 RepID=UPI002306F72A|nr:lipid II flippase MurJ [Streptomyces sp. ACA25]MDB1086299.1 lipid II flippase MurJ [Streptomyces sp. ACA25]